MIYSKSIQVDIARQYLNDVIRLHEGDASGAQLQISMYNNGDVFNLSGLTIKYDAVGAGYLAEQDATASVLSGTNNVIVVPITANMCAKSGTLEIDVKLIQGSGSSASVLFLQRFEAIVQRRVINEDVIIDVSGTTIGAKFADIEGKMISLLNISSDAIDTATDDRTIYIVYTEEARYARLFCATKGNLRTQYRFDSYGYVKMRRQRQVNGEWEAWQAWTPIATSENIAAVAVSTSKIAESAVTADKIASGAVTTGKIASGAVTTGKIDTVAVSTAKIADGAVTSEKIDTGAVTTGKIDGSAVTEAKIADEAITTAKIKDLNVTTAKIASGAVTATKIAGDSIGNVKLMSGAVSTAKIADNAVTYAKLAADVGEHLMSLSPNISNDNTGSLQQGQIFKSGTAYYVKSSSATQVGAQSRLAMYSELNDLANVVGNANDLLEAALNYQS